MWQQLQNVLKQRNASLKNRLPSNEIQIWDQELGNIGSEIDLLRKKYVDALQPVLNGILNSLLRNHDLTLCYYRGWKKDQDLYEVLSNGFEKDRQMGFTQSGPQRADLQLYSGSIPAHDHLSQGQQKLAAYALHLAQGILFKQQTSQSPLYLIDDLPSELDPEKRNLITEVLLTLESQVFITGITKEDLTDLINMTKGKLFHVEHGQVNSCVMEA